MGDLASSRFSPFVKIQIEHLIRATGGTLVGMLLPRLTMHGPDCFSVGTTRDTRGKPVDIAFEASRPARATRDKSGQIRSGELSARICDFHVSNIDDKSDKSPAPLRGLIEQRLELGRLSQVLRWNGSPSMPNGLPPSNLSNLRQTGALNLGAPDPILSVP